MGSFVNRAGEKRKELIMFKAKKNLEELERKYPEFKIVEETKKETKSKGKK